MPREVMFTGSVPLSPAMSVYKGTCDHGLKGLMGRIPDGEQGGWGIPLSMSFTQNPALEPDGDPVPFTNRPAGVDYFNAPIQAMRLKPGHSAEELMLDDMGIAASFAESWAQFQQAKAEGLVAPETRFAATLPSPAVIALMLHIPVSEFGPVLGKMYANEIQKILGFVPHDMLTIQFDVAAEIGIDEMRRQGPVWDAPMFRNAIPYWPFDGSISLIADMANTVPEPVELGFHFCSFYHADESGGQDLNVHVDWVNTMVDKVKRQINYIHVPSTPDYGPDDFEPLSRFKISDKTKLFIGLIHAADDGLEGAKRRIEAAKVHRQDFGVASLCGLKVPSLAQKANPLSIEEVLDLHRQVAELD